MSFNIIDHLEQTADIDDAVSTAFHRLTALRTETTRLQALDPANVTPYYHRDAHGEPRYLWLIYPQRNGERIREYVGSKEEKIKAALIRVQAHRDLVEAKRQIADIKARLGLISRYLAAALRAAKGGMNRED